MAQHKKILLVEDNLEISRMYERAFRLNGYDICITHDGASALKELTESDVVPEAVLLDIMMPHLDGIHVLEAVRKDARFAAMPIVVLTNSFRKEDAQRFLDLGADLYLVKIEYQSKEIVEKVEALIQSGRPQKT